MLDLGIQDRDQFQQQTHSSVRELEGVGRFHTQLRAVEGIVYWDSACQVGVKFLDVGDIVASGDEGIVKICPADSRPGDTFMCRSTAFHMLHQKAPPVYVSLELRDKATRCSISHSFCEKLLIHSQKCLESQDWFVWLHPSQPLSVQSANKTRAIFQIAVTVEFRVFISMKYPSLSRFAD